MTDIDVGVSNLAKLLRTTWPKDKVKLDFGYFANVIDIGGVGVAITTDGIGSKAMIAAMLDCYDTVGVDCVAMNVNDVVCVGAQPLAMVDYIALETPSVGIIDQIGIGLHRGAEEAGVALIGGETALLGDMVSGFDLTGTVIGNVPLDRILTGKNIKKGDVLIGIESNGIHSNGLTLARKVFHLSYQMGLHHCRTILSQHIEELKPFMTLGDELLRMTFIYSAEAMELINNIKSLRALINITGDGFHNLARVQAHVGFVIDNLPDPPAIFTILQHRGGLDDSIMYSTFNMGIGFCAIVGEEDATAAIDLISNCRSKRAYRLGHAVEDPSRRIRLAEKKLISNDAKRFEIDASKP